MDRPERDAKLQAALVAVRDSMAAVGHAWFTQRATSSVRGVLRMTIGLEPVFAPITTAQLILALAKHGIRPRTVRPRAGIDVRVRHTVSGVEIDFAIASKLSARTARHLDQTLGKGWRKRGPVG